MDWMVLIKYLILRLWRPQWMLGPSQSHQCSGSRESQRVSLSLMSGYTGAESGAKTWELTVLRTILTPALLNWVLSYTWGLRRSGDQEIRLTRLMLIGLKMPFIFYVFDDLASSLIFKLRFWRFDIILLYNICVSLRCGGFSIIILTVWVKWQKIL